MPGTSDEPEDGPVDAVVQQIKIAIASIGALVEAAGSGGFTLDEAGGRALLKAIRDLRDELDDESGLLRRLESTPLLGWSHAARVIAVHNRDVAVDTQGALTRLREFRTSLDLTEQALSGAIRYYDDAEQDNSWRLRDGLEPW